MDRGDENAAEGNYREAEIPENIKNRMRENVWECFPTEDKQLVCMFKDNTVRKVDLTRLVDKYKDILYVLKNKELLEKSSL